MSESFVRSLSRAEIKALSLEERMDLIADVWSSFDEEEVPVTVEQLSELDRRLATFDADKADAESWSTVRARILSELG